MVLLLVLRVVVIIRVEVVVLESGCGGSTSGGWEASPLVAVTSTTEATGSALAAASGTRATGSGAI